MSSHTMGLKYKTKYNDSTRACWIWNSATIGRANSYSQLGPTLLVGYSLQIQRTLIE